MQKKSYFDYIYKIDGENLVKNPKLLFEPKGVYLFIDKPLNLIWIWAGLQSRLFHRYIAANWAGKLKNNKEFLGFKYEVIKEGREPIEFQYISGEIRRGPEKYTYPGESRKKKKSREDLKKNDLEDFKSPLFQNKLTKSLKKTGIYRNNNISKIYSILNEIKEIHTHVKYSIQHIDKRINQIENLLKNFNNS